jgi:gluconolactonase
MTKVLFKVVAATCLACAVGIGASYAATSTPPPVARGDGPAPASEPFRIERLDPALDAIVDPAAKLEVKGDRYGLTEGPVWVQDGSGGYLLFSDLIENVVYKLMPDGGVSVYLDQAGYSGNDLNNAGTQTRRGRAFVLMIGPNGETMDSQGRLIWCASPDGTIVRLEKDGSRTVLAGKYQGKRFNGPNDLVATSDGAVYFTDSDFGLRGGSKSPDKELSFNGVYLVKDGKVTLLVSTEGKQGSWPNGIALSPDQKHLYLSEGFARIMSYPIKSDDTLGTPTVLTEGGGGIGDGMKTDLKGNLYSTGGAGPGHVRITSPDGKILGRIYLPVIGGEPKRQICATNVAFGDPDGKGLYITACEAVYRIRLKTAGVMPGSTR